MNEIVSGINKFVDAMIDSKDKLESIQIEISNKEKEIENLIKKLNSDIEDIIKKERRNSDIGDINEIFDTTSKFIDGYFKNAFIQIDNTRKGMKFIQDFEKCFIVSVFGKVKSGKSSIGNFVMGNDLKKYKINSSYDKLGAIKVQVYDRGEMTEQTNLNVLEEGFKEGSTETTSTIQWFELGGLSWFDTPGIGSITIENENLAKEYVKNSDLVIFTCNSDAAGTTQEFDEMKKLFSMGKQILLLITMSDTYDEDEDENGEIVQTLVPKSNKDRKDVEEYMYETLIEHNISKILNNRSILTVSSKLAKEAIKNNDINKYDDSNMQLLLDLLIDITSNEAAQLKMNNPKQRINKLISQLINDDDNEDNLSLNNIKIEFNEKIESLLKNKQELHEDEEILIEDIKNTCYNKINNEIEMYKSRVEKQKTKVSSQEINNKIIQVVQSVVQEKAKLYLDKYINEIDTNVFNTLNEVAITVDDMEMKKDCISYEQERVVRRNRDPKGILEKAGAFIFKKKYYDIKVIHETKYSYFDLGINDSEITRNIIHQLDDVFNSVVKDIINELIDGYFKPMEEVRKNINELIDKNIQKLGDMRIK